jgi:hypothetical protein
MYGLQISDLLPQLIRRLLLPRQQLRQLKDSPIFIKELRLILVQQVILVIGFLDF